MRPDGVLGLVRMARGSDKDAADAWEALIRRAQPDLLDMAARLLPAHWRGESVSVVLGRVWEKGRHGIAHFHGADTARDDSEATRVLLAWLRAVVRSAVFDYFKEVSRQPGPAVPVTDRAPEDGESAANGFIPIDPTLSVLTQLANAEQSVRLQKALAALTESDRVLLLRMFSGEQSLRDLARTLSLNEKTLRERRERIIKRLRKEMEGLTP